MYYLFESLDLSNYNSGSVQAMLNRNFIADVPVVVPDLPEQRRISGVLRRIDDLIAANESLAANLSETARLTAANWMAALGGPPTKPLTDCCTVTKGYSYKSTELVGGSDTLLNLKNIGRGGVFKRSGFKPLMSSRYKQEQILHADDVVVSMTDLTQNRDVIARPVRVPDASVQGAMVASLDLVILRPKAGYSSAFLYAALVQDRFREFALGYCNGTTVLHLSPRVFDDYLVPDFAPEQLSDLAVALRAIHAQQDACHDEIGDLRMVRDRLLRPLMSGEVRVRELERVR